MSAVPHRSSLGLINRAADQAQRREAKARAEGYQQGIVDGQIRAEKSALDYARKQVERERIRDRWTYAGVAACAGYVFGIAAHIALIYVTGGAA